MSDPSIRMPFSEVVKGFEDITMPLSLQDLKMSYEWGYLVDAMPGLREELKTRLKDHGAQAEDGSGLLQYIYTFDTETYTPHSFEEGSLTVAQPGRVVLMGSFRLDGLMRSDSTSDIVVVNDLYPFFTEEGEQTMGLYSQFFALGSKNNVFYRVGASTSAGNGSLEPKEDTMVVKTERGEGNDVLLDYIGMDEDGQPTVIPIPGTIDLTRDMEFTRLIKGTYRNEAHLDGWSFARSILDETEDMFPQYASAAD